MLTVCHMKYWIIIELRKHHLNGSLEAVLFVLFFWVICVLRHCIVSFVVSRLGLFL